MKNWLLLLLCWGAWLSGQAQEAPATTTDEDAFYIRRIYDKALTDSRCYSWLEYLTTRIGGRLSGSPQAAASVEYTRWVLDTIGFDTVWLQPCMVPHWVRGDAEQVRVVNSRKMGSLELRALALGNSVGTGPAGLTAEVIEVDHLDDLEKLGRSRLEGKIVFFNRPFDPTHLNTFAAYGGAVDQRAYGAARAARFGAVGVLVRSMTSRLDDVPHTGSLAYEEGTPRIPAFGISTNDAELLSSLLKEEPVRVYMRSTCMHMGEALSYNVIAEMRGSERPGDIILVGGHLDSWDVSGGAHDDGAGCVQSMEVLRLFKTMGYKPKRTLRCVLFMNEENGLMGGRTYISESNKAREYHMAAIESDRGGFTPRGFTCEGDATVFEAKFKKLALWMSLLEPYGLRLSKGGSGADIGGLKSQKGLLIGFEPDSQRYFDFHHAPIDNFDSVNKRELELGAAAMTALVYLLDKYGLD